MSDAGDMHDETVAAAAAVPADAPAAAPASSSAARKRKSGSAADDHPAAQPKSRAGRQRAVVNYNEDARAEADERKDRDDDEEAAADDDGGDDGSEASAPVARKKRRSGPAAGSKKKRAPTSAASAAAAAVDPDDDDPYEHPHDGEEERKSAGAVRKKRTSKGTGAAAAAAARRGREAAAALDREAVASDDESLQDERRFSAAAASSSSAAPMTPAELSAFVAGDRRPPRPLRPLDSSRVCESGILLSLSLRNFMNHRNFGIEFNPNVNFIHGKNGSGKSSILHAIQVVFGSAARETSRGSAMKALIHYGKEEAEITVVVKNEGDSAFKHDAYGDSIRIVRRIKRSGGGGYQFFNGESGALVSRETRELRDLTEHFNIQVSNPCVIMTQEVSKKFLQSQRAEDKYTFFLKATQLEWLRQNLADSRDQIAQMMSTIQMEQDKIPDLDKRIKYLKQQEALAQEAESLEKEIRELIAAAAWKQVQDLEIEFDRREFELNGLDAAINSCVEKRAAIEAEFGGKAALDEAHAKHETAIKAAGQRAQECARLQVIKEAEIKKIKHDQRQLISRMELLQNKIVAHRKTKEKNDREIARIAEANSKDNSEANAAREAKMEAIKETRGQVEEQIAAKRAEMAAQQPLEVEAQRAESTALADLNQSRTRLSKAEADLRMMMSESGASAAAGASKHNYMFGLHTAKFWREIENEQWTHKPIGPLGEYVQVPDEHAKWLIAINQCMKQKEMSMYIVDNFDDQQKLQAIFKRVMQQERRFKPIIQIIPFGAKEKYKMVKPKVNFPLVIDCIRVENPVAFNAVLFACKPERHGLHSDINTAVSEIAQHRPGSGGNDFVTGSFLTNGAKISLRGEGGSTIREAPREPQLFRVDHAERIRELKAVVDECKAKFAAATEEHEKQRNLVQSFDPTKHALRYALSKLNTKLAQLDEQLGELEDEAQREQYNRSRLDDTHLVQANTDLLNEIGELEASIEAIRAQDSSHFADRIAALEAEKEKLMLAESTAQTELQTEEDLQAKFMRKWVKQDAKIKSLRAAEKEHQEKRTEVALGLARISSTLEQAEKEASLLSDKVVSDEPEKVLVAKITAKQNTLAEKKKRNPIDVIKVRDELKAAQALREQTEARMAGSISTHEALKQASQRRIKKLAEFRRTLADAASLKFNELLSKSGAAGRLEFDPKEQTLNLIVNTDVRDSDRAAAANTVALSGGERSTTTISFVLAVGENVECPFRAIDEFDVFMDSINRRTAMNMLLADAKSRRDRQFFFLTPQDISALPRDDPYLKLHVLADPPRDHQQRRIDTMINGDEEDEE